MAGCTSQSAETKLVIAKFGEEEIYLEEIQFYLIINQVDYEKEYVKQYPGENIWNMDILGTGNTLEDDVKQSILQETKKMHILLNKAEEFGITTDEKDEEERDDMLEELIDRFGEPPRSVLNLLEISNVRNMAHNVYVTEVSDKGEGIKFIMYEKAKVHPEHIPELLGKYKGELNFKPDAIPYFVYKAKGNKLKENKNVLENVKLVLNDLKMLLDE